jgi:hypothetical protein
MSDDLALYPIEDIIAELKRRNISFIFAYADHTQFTKVEGVSQEIVWGADRGGNLALQGTLQRFLNAWMEHVVQEQVKGTPQ